MNYLESERALATKIASHKEFGQSGYGYRETELFRKQISEGGVDVPLEEITDGVRDAFNDIIASRWKGQLPPKDGREMIERGFYVRTERRGN